MSVRAYYDSVLELACEIGRALLINGAEIYRTEESISRILQCYDVTSGEVFVLPGCIIVSARTPDGHSATRVRRIQNRTTDIYLLEEYNRLCRTICREHPPLENAMEEISAIQNHAVGYSRVMQLLGYFLGCAGFTYIFCPSLGSTFCGGLCGAVMGVVVFWLADLQVNAFFKNLVGAAVAATLATITTQLGLGTSSSAITIGALMVLFPGIALTNSIRDIMAGDMMSGITKLGEVFLIACAIALGAGVAVGFLPWIGGWA